MTDIPEHKRHLLIRAIYMLLMALILNLCGHAAMPAGQHPVDRGADG